jgi:hypothetical protein
MSSLTFESAFKQLSCSSGKWDGTVDDLPSYMQLLRALASEAPNGAREQADQRTRDASFAQQWLQRARFHVEPGETRSRLRYIEVDVIHTLDHLETALRAATGSPARTMNLVVSDLKLFRPVVGGNVKFCHARLRALIAELRSYGQDGLALSGYFYGTVAENCLDPELLERWKELHRLLQPDTTEPAFIWQRAIC